MASLRLRARLKIYRRKNALMKKYGMTLEDYTALYTNQFGRCAICGKPEADDGRWKRLAVDHNHSTGKIRGLLCIKCNVRLGVLENSAWCVKAQQYISHGEMI